MNDPHGNVGLGALWPGASLAANTGLARVLWFGRHRGGWALLAGALFFAVTLDYDGAHANPGTTLLKQERLEQGDEPLPQFEALDTGLRDSFQNMAEKLRAQGKYEESLQWYRAASEAAPDQPHPYAGLGDSLYQLKRYGEAVEALERAVSLHPPDVMAGSVHRHLGISLQELERPDEAMPHFERAIEIDSDDEESVDRLGTIHFAQKRYVQMLELYQGQVEAGNADARVHTNMGTALYFLRRFEEALHSFELALALKPDQAMALQGSQRSRQQLEAERAGSPTP